jgi:hypothetical protein
MMEYYLVIQRNKVLTDTLMTLENMLTEIRHECPEEANS